VQGPATDVVCDAGSAGLSPADLAAREGHAAALEALLAGRSAAPGGVQGGVPGHQQQAAEDGGGAERAGLRCGPAAAVDGGAVRAARAATGPSETARLRAAAAMVWLAVK
jgi:hypothetical protein